MRNKQVSATPEAPTARLLIASKDIEFGMTLARFIEQPGLEMPPPVRLQRTGPRQLDVHRKSVSRNEILATSGPKKTGEDGDVVALAKLRRLV